MSTHWDMEIDILVIGAGGCGLAAALSANEMGVEVGVVEKYEEFQGNTTLSTGSVPGAGTRFQREAGIDDSPEKLIEDLLRKSGPHEAEELTRLLAHQSAPLVEWLVDCQSGSAPHHGLSPRGSFGASTSCPTCPEGQVSPRRYVARGEGQKYSCGSRKPCRNPCA